MIRKVKFGNATISYTIVKSNRIKTSQITVDKDSVTVRTPDTKKISEIKEIVDAKKQWIFRKQLEFQKRDSINVKPTYASGSKLQYLGTNLTLKIEKNAKKESVKLKNDTITISVKSKKSSKAQIKKLYYEWLTKKASKLFETQLAKYSKKMKLKPSKLNIKNLKDRWGSATSTNVINLNVNLIKAPRSVIDYVIVHELSHLKIKGHSPKFWRYLRRFMPEYEKQKLWLEQNSNLVS